ncbi:hypothetical protein RBSH_03185 [Rhodopirellula baltica SH28]|uniref:Uncharacterized protein n=3 Tax=Rhodopirellula baltica TaxID=265606 RepID=F2ANM0_RHOBT|nr:hypothetical protein RBWH47_03798 [Rhodopirellula baltica WH47]EKK01519.1 hypothetical protein RBSH_03185 [Rhodopirellula baltica SH28]ELP29980.1 hypothetical protein RBSWK_06068 [Rhodopirellula baltica SWK14]
MCGASLAWTRPVQRLPKTIMPLDVELYVALTRFENNVSLL